MAKVKVVRKKACPKVRVARALLEGDRVRMVLGGAWRLGQEGEVVGVQENGLLVVRFDGAATTAVCRRGVDVVRL